MSHIRGWADGKGVERVEGEDGWVNDTS